MLAVGDGANDLGMLGMAGMGVALHAKPVVAAECDLRVNHGDLTALLYLQGYREGRVRRLGADGRAAVTTGDGRWCRAGLCVSVVSGRLGT